MNATFTQIQSDAAQQHNIAFEMAAAEVSRRSPNTDRLDPSLLAAKLCAECGADSSSLPQTIFRTPGTAGWWHTHCHA